MGELRYDSAVDAVYLGAPNAPNSNISVSPKSIELVLEGKSVFVKTKPSRVVKEDLLSEIEFLEKAARTAKIPIHRVKNYTAWLDTNWNKYREEYKYAGELFEALVKKAEKVKARGIHINWKTQDAFLENLRKGTLTYAENIKKLGYMGTVMSIQHIVRTYTDDIGGFKPVPFVEL